MAHIRVEHEIISDKSKNPVVSSEYVKHGAGWLSDTISTLGNKADKSYVDSKVAEKADKSYVDTELAKKANSSDLSGKADASTVSALSGRVSTNETNIAAANTRIDNIVQTPSGSTEGNAELIDIRTGADGKNYSTAGAAVRGQITDLKSDLIQLETKGYPQASISEAVNTWGTEHLNEFVPNKSITISKLSDDVITKLEKGCVCPDDFEGTDTQKLQKAFDYFSDNLEKSGTIVINRKYTITSDIIIKRSAVTASAGNITVMGIGKESTLFMSNCQFKGNVQFTGGVKFINVHFLGAETGRCFYVDDKLIRMYFISCRFEKFEDAIYINGLVQQWRFMQCYFEENTGKCFNGVKGSIYCLTVDSCDFEHNGTAFWFSDTDSTWSPNTGIVVCKAEITKCVIENNTTVGIRLSNYTKGMTISDCYFESNPISIDMRQCFNPIYVNGIYVSNNIIDLPNNGIGIYVPISSGHITVLDEQKLAILVNNHAHANGNTGGELIVINGNPSNHSLYYDMDTLTTGPYTPNSDVCKTMHRYNLKYHQFYVTTNKEIKAGESYPIMNGADFINATGSTALEFFCQIRNGVYPCAITRNPSNQALQAMFFVDVPSGTTMTFNLAYRN